MIELLGVEGTSEYQAALSIRNAIAKLWPGIDSSPVSSDHVVIVAGAKISGYKVSDIDVVVCGIFHKPRAFMPRRLLYDETGQRVGKKPVRVRNLVLAVEVKDHGASSVQVNADNLLVRYTQGGKETWKSAIDQNDAQVHSLRPYLKEQVGCDVFVHRCLVMQGLSEVKLAGVVPAKFDGKEFLTAVASVKPVRKDRNGYYLSSGSLGAVEQALGSSLFKLARPTGLDRQRMDRIVTEASDEHQITRVLGKKMVRLRGYGGSGKTVMLLQSAWRLYQERGARSIILTYNHALAADIRRLLALLGVPSNPDNGGIAVLTVMSFMYSWFWRLGLVDDDQELNFGEYEAHCESALKLVREGALTKEDIERARLDYLDQLGFDYVFVDEAQDWPQPEAELLKALYGTSRIALADGVDQLVRGKATRWELNMSQEQHEVIFLSRCLRMKKNLATFANQAARSGKVNWAVKPNTEAPGGQAYLLTKGYESYPELHDRLVAMSADKGNAEVDFLFCIPPSGVVVSDGQKKSQLGNFLESRGAAIWDGVDPLLRKDYPRSQDQFRIVQYASCRGLEGWVVVLQDADTYWDMTRQEYIENGFEKEGGFETLDELSEQTAWLKILVALTRPIDTLVIALRDTSSPFSRKLLGIADKFPDIIERFD